MHKSDDELFERLGKAVLARDAVDELYHEAFGPLERLLHSVCASLPLSMIPVVVLWTVVFLVTSYETGANLGYYVLGLMALVLGSSALMALRALLGRRRLPDLMHMRVADHMSRLAYYPNWVLKQQLRRRGSVTRDEFRFWYLRQREILENRVRDLKVQAPQALDTPTTCPYELAEGAKRILDTK